MKLIWLIIQTSRSLDRNRR